MEISSEIIKYLDKGHIMLEWGSGGSTLKFPKYVKEYYSIEHDSGWYHKIKQQIPSNCFLDLIVPNDPEWDDWNWIPNHKFFDIEEFKKIQKEHYGLINYSICRYMQLNDYVNNPLCRKYDRVLIDGRARSSCAKLVIPYLKEGGLVFFDDFKYRQDEHANILNWYDIIEYYDTLAVLKPNLTKLKEDILSNTVVLEKEYKDKIVSSGTCFDFTKL